MASKKKDQANFFRLGSDDHKTKLAKTRNSLQK